MHNKDRAHVVDSKTPRKGNRCLQLEIVKEWHLESEQKRHPWSENHSVPAKWKLGRLPFWARVLCSGDLKGPIPRLGRGSRSGPDYFRSGLIWWRILVHKAAYKGRSSFRGFCLFVSEKKKKKAYLTHSKEWATERELLLLLIELQ